MFVKYSGRVKGRKWRWKLRRYKRSRIRENKSREEETFGRFKEQGMKRYERKEKWRIKKNVKIFVKEMRGELMRKKWFKFLRVWLRKKVVCIA